MPNAVDGGEPEQFLVLDAARAALADAGLADGIARRSAGRGDHRPGELLQPREPDPAPARPDRRPDAGDPRVAPPRVDRGRSRGRPADLKASLPPFGPATVPGQLTNATAGRVANRLDLTGASYVVDAASASSLVALDLGAQALAERRADLALVGGVYLEADVDFPLVFRQLGALSRSGAVEAVRRATPTGCSRAKGWASSSSSDGPTPSATATGSTPSSRASASPATAEAWAWPRPSARGHARAIRRAYRVERDRPGHGRPGRGARPGRAGRRPGRAAGPPGRLPADRPGRRVLGAVSSMIGHAMPAAGMAGLIKAALALAPSGPAADPARRSPHPLLDRRRQPVHPQPDGPPLGPGRPDHPPAGRGERLRVRRDQRPRRSWRSTPPRPTPTTLRAPAPLGHRGDPALGRPIGPGLIERVRPLLAIGSTEPRPGRRRSEGSGLHAQHGRCRRTLPPRAGREVARRPGRSPRGGPGEARRPGLPLDPRRPGDVFLGASRRRVPEAGVPVPRRGVAVSRDAGRPLPALPRGPRPLRHLRPDRPRVGSARPGRASTSSASRPARTRRSGRPRSRSTSSSRPSGRLYQLLIRSSASRPDAVVGHSSGELLALAAAGVLEVDRTFEDRLGELGAIFGRLETSGDLPTARLVAVAADPREGRGRDRARAIGSRSRWTTARIRSSSRASRRRSRRSSSGFEARGMVCEDLPFARAYHTPGFAPALGPIAGFFDSLDAEPRLGSRSTPAPSKGGCRTTPGDPPAGRRPVDPGRRVPPDGRGDARRRPRRLRRRRGPGEPGRVRRGHAREAGPPSPSRRTSPGGRA